MSGVIDLVADQWVDLAMIALAIAVVAYSELSRRPEQ